MAILKGNISVILSRKHVHFWTSKERHLNKLPFLFMFKYERKKSMTGFKRNKNRIVVNQFTKIYLPKYWHSRYVEGLENNLSNLILSSFLVFIRFWMEENRKLSKRWCWWNEIVVKKYGENSWKRGLAYLLVHPFQMIVPCKVKLKQKMKNDQMFAFCPVCSISILFSFIRVKLRT